VVIGASVAGVAVVNGSTVMPQTGSMTVVGTASGAGPRLATPCSLRFPGAILRATGSSRIFGGRTTAQARGERGNLG
jgi:hypothetical protein